MVPIGSIVCMLISLLVGIAIPVGLLLYFMLKKKADILPFFIGCAVMLIFALILEQLMHAAVLASSVGETIRNNILLYAVYGGLAAGVFEETGRFVAFKTVLKSFRGKDINALMYGAGHGGLEVFVILVIGMINNIITSIMVDTGLIDATIDRLLNEAPEAVEQLNSAIDTLAATKPYEYLMGGAERISAVMLQLSLSVLVWFAVKNKDKLYLYPLAIVIHLAVDSGTVLMMDAGMPIAALEATVFATACVLAFFTYRFYERQTAYSAKEA